MELKDKLRQILKDRYGIESDTDVMKELENFQGVDFGIFVNPQKDEAKSA